MLARMLLELQIENYALIERLAVEFAPGLNVLSGETGSGKSIVVDALALLLGERAETSAVRAGEDRASVTGRFAAGLEGLAAELEALGLAAEEEIVVRREVGARGRVWINDQAATVAALRRLAPYLAQVHAQEEALAGWSPAAQLARLDAAVGGNEELAALAAAYAAWRAARRERDDGLRQDAERLREADLWRFQHQELAEAALRAGEDEELDGERRRLVNAERIGAAAAGAYEALYDGAEAAAVGLKQALRQVQELARLEPEAGELIPRLEAVRIEVQDVAGRLRGWTEPPEATADRLAQVEERLAVLTKIKRKYGPDLAAAMAYAAGLEAKLERLERQEEWRQQAEARLRDAEAEYRRQAGQRSARRRAGAKKIAAEAAAEAADLGMQLRLEIAFSPHSAGEPESDDWGAGGCDQVRYLAATNPGEPLRPFDQIASGGERSRLLLALETAALHRAGAAARGAAGGVVAPTQVFDEIDAGIGGRAAEAVGRKLAALARRDQILCVTHLAQIASHAAHHLRVEKLAQQGRVVTRVTRLEGPARIEEIARRLAGATTPAARRHAEELLQKAAGR